MIVDNDVNILFTSMVAGSYTETRWKKLSFTHGYQRRFAEFPENERCHVSYLSILVANIFFELFSVILTKFRPKIEYYDKFETASL